MKSRQSHITQMAVLVAAVALLSTVFSTKAFAQRMRVAHERQAPTRILHLPPNHTRIEIGGRPYFYHNGYFYRGWRGRYVIFRPPIGARMGFLPYGFWSFHIGPMLYFYGGGAYYQYLPDENVYVVVPKPSQAPTQPSSNEDTAYLTDGTTLSGVFVGATADSIQFQVKDEVRNIPITNIKSITFAPSTFKEQK